MGRGEGASGKEADESQEPLTLMAPTRPFFCVAHEITRSSSVAVGWGDGFLRSLLQAYPLEQQT